MESTGGNVCSLTLRAQSLETAPVHTPTEAWPGLGQLNSAQDIVLANVY
jgi:hypothetical protein